MSKIGKRPVALEKGVSVSAGAGFFEVKGPKGAVRRALPTGYGIEITGTDASVVAKDEASKLHISRMGGTIRAHLSNAVVGVTKGYERKLKLEGTGYRAELKGQQLILSVGKSHPEVYELPKAVSVKIPPESKGMVLELATVDKDLLGQVVAKLQSFRPPEPYKGKGVRIDGVTIRRKAGKAGKGKGGK